MTKVTKKLHAERLATSQKVASAVLKEQSKRKASEVKTTELTKTLSHEKERVAAATSLANAAIMLKQQAEQGVVRSTKQHLEENYRNLIEKLQEELKSSNLLVFRKGHNGSSAEK